MRSVSEQIAEYRPVRVPAAHWAVIGDRVRALVCELDPQTVEVARMQLMRLTQYLAWCWQVGYSLEHASVTNPRILDDYLTHIDRVQGRATARSHRDKLNVYITRLAGPARPTFSSTQVPLENQPYSQSELTAISGWAAGQPTERWRHNASAIVALAGGCGLRASELIQVRGQDLHTSGERIAVHVDGAPPRFAPTLAFWEQTLRTLRDHTHPDEHLFIIEEGVRSARKVPAFIARTRGQSFRPTAERLRATWIHTLVAAGLPADLILQTAGLKSAISLNPYLAQLPRRSDSPDTWAQVHAAGQP
ncbi:hypothetical protein ASE14_09655 [Agromyces sp. Root81]|nr:hypothetical protein ASE14_09655 [Agromyces sp. Root81]